MNLSDVEIFAIVVLLCLSVGTFIYGAYNVYTYTKYPNYKVQTLPFNTDGFIKVSNIVNYFEGHVGLGGAGGVGIPEIICNNFSQFKHLSGNSTIYYCFNNSMIKFMSVNHGIAYEYTYKLKSDLYSLYQINGNKAILKKQSDVGVIFIAISLLLFGLTAYLLLPEFK